ncbi:hypothetical protein O181_013400 [Austropuccinia psidii MF-1]|uniref:Uncharacterized protein n=1 Tax=Austropuccinia psidii MF-1 TaxID=1389203 RepID=A0A9Q3BZS8_9BASI|nr:hypothetical protein [Austropuccinia psidii MF-1]
MSCKDKLKKIKNLLKNQSLLSIDQRKELEMNPDLEKEGPAVSTSSKPAPEVSKEKTKGPQKKQRGPKNIQGKGKGKENCNRPYPKGYRIPKLNPSAVENLKIQNSFKSAIFNSDKDKPLTWFLKQKDRFFALHPNMSGSMMNMKVLRKCGGELENYIKCRCVKPCSTEGSIYAMKYIINRTRIGKTWNRNPIMSNIVPKSSEEDTRAQRPVLKFYKFGSTSNFASTCTKKAKFNEEKVIEEIQCAEEESDQDSEISEDTPKEEYPIENIAAFFEVTEVHTHFPHSSESCYNMINI